MRRLLPRLYLIGCLCDHGAVSVAGGANAAVGELRRADGIGVSRPFLAEDIPDTRHPGYDGLKEDLP